jgi:hypothetical protein
MIGISNLVATGDNAGMTLSYTIQDASYIMMRTENSILTTDMPPYRHGKVF